MHQYSIEDAYEFAFEHRVESSAVIRARITAKARRMLWIGMLLIAPLMLLAPIAPFTDLFADLERSVRDGLVSVVVLLSLLGSCYLVGREALDNELADLQPAEPDELAAAARLADVGPEWRATISAWLKVTGTLRRAEYKVLKVGIKALDIASAEAAFRERIQGATPAGSRLGECVIAVHHTA